jgi:hypothetical protein
MPCCPGRLALQIRYQERLQITHKRKTQSLSHQIHLQKKSVVLKRSCDWLWAVWPRAWTSSPRRVKNFYFSISSRLAMGPTQPPIQWVPEVMQPGREADHSPQPVSCSKEFPNYTIKKNSCNLLAYTDRATAACRRS